MAQSVKHLTLDLSPGLDLSIMSSSPELGSRLGSALGLKPTLKKKNVILNKDEMVPLYSALFKPYLEYSVKFQKVH